MPDLELLLDRLWKKPKRTLGLLYANGRFFSFVLEDEVREIPGKPVSSWKIKGKTAVPEGRYLVILEPSPKFGPNTPTIVDVPGFKYIRIHAGNDEDDTEGCLMVGDTLSIDFELRQSRIARDRLKGIIAKTIGAGDKCWITIRTLLNG